MTAFFLLGSLASAEPAAATATVRVKQPPMSAPHCGVLHIVSLALVEAVAPTAGLPEEPFWVAVSCPELNPALEAGATACMTVSAKNPGWPGPINPSPAPGDWLYALEIRDGACD